MIKLFISRLPFALTEQKLSDLFVPYGQVFSAKIYLNPIRSDNLSCAYVVMADLTDAITAIRNLNGSVLNGKAINVSIAKNGRKH